MPNGKKINYPRKKYIRVILIIIGKILIRTLTKFKLSGIENFPKNGPYIVAGNHVAALEALLMVLFTPKLIELLGAGDIPLDPNLAGFANLYGYIPIFRGSIDQTGLKTALSVLEQDGVIGIFPEGGIWNEEKKQAKIGVSWLSYKSGAPVIPVAFIGMKGSIKSALSFKKPKIEMVVGPAINQDELILNLLPIKQELLNGANLIMEKIYQMVPDFELDENIDQFNNHLKLSIHLLDKNTKSFQQLYITEISAISFLLNQPVLMNVFIKNLKLPVKVLARRNIPIKINEFINGCNSILTYLEKNPGFLNYRIGIENGIAIKIGLTELSEICKNNKQQYSEVMISSSENIPLETK